VVSTHGAEMIYHGSDF